jgi:alcohol dehydrogenase YqhD (iron-dependent ADH family)
MNNFEFFNPVRIVFGKGEVAKAGSEAARIGKRALLVSYQQLGPMQPLVARIETMLTAAGVTGIPFYAVSPNPLLSQVEAGVALAKHEKVDFVIGIGGGSAMDAAKCIAAGVLYPEDLSHMIATSHSGGAIVKFPAQALPLLMVPTLPATASEMNCCAVITNDRNTRKSYCWDPCLYPKVSIVDPELTCTLPVYQTACGAADTISHVLEFYLNGLEGTPLNYRIQEGVVQTVMERLPAVLLDPNDIDARSDLQWSAIMALNGISQPGNGWTPMHQLGHVLSARHNIAHGASLAIIMPAWMKLMYKRRLDRYVRFARTIFLIDPAGKTDDQIALEGIAAFEAFLRGIGVPTRLGEAKVAAPLPPAEYASDVKTVSFNADGFLPSHTPVSLDDVRQIFTLAL